MTSNSLTVTNWLDVCGTSGEGGWGDLRLNTSLLKGVWKEGVWRREGWGGGGEEEGGVCLGVIYNWYMHIET